MKISTQLQFDRAVDQFAGNRNRLVASQEQVAAGTQIVRPSDDPTLNAKVVDVTNSITKSESLINNMDTVLSRMGAQEVALQSSVDILTRMRELAVLASTSTYNGVDRQIYATEARGLVDDLAALGNFQDDAGNYVFAGSRNQSAPFVADANGEYSYQGDQEDLRVQIGEQRMLDLSRVGRDVYSSIDRVSKAETWKSTSFDTFLDSFNGDQPFDISLTVDGVAQTATVSEPTISGIEEALRGLTTDLDITIESDGEGTGTRSFFVRGDATGTTTFELQTTGSDFSFQQVQPAREVEKIQFFETLYEFVGALETSDVAELEDKVDELTALGEQVALGQAQVGTQMEAIERQRNIQDEVVLSLKELKSSIHDLDYAEAMTRMNANMLALESAQASFAKISQLSLFNYLS